MPRAQLKSQESICSTESAFDADSEKLLVDYRGLTGQYLSPEIFQWPTRAKSEKTTRPW